MAGISGISSNRTMTQYSDPPTPLVDVAHLDFRYPERALYHDLSLRISRGKVTVIMGPSGCGKTTLLNCLSGLDSFDEGNILIQGKSLSDQSDDQLSEFRAKKMGFVFQTYNLLPVLTAVENVELPLLVSGYSGKDARAKAIEKLVEVDLENQQHQLPGQLSGGQRQRVTPVSYTHLTLPTKA